MTLDCKHRPPCPGCPRLGDQSVPPNAREALAQLAARAGVEHVPHRRGERTGFRHRARLAVRGRSRAPKIGIFQEGTHRVADIPGCLVHHPRINEVARGVKRAMRESASPTYSDDAHAGLVRYLQVTVERTSTLAQLVVVTNDSTSRSARPLLDVIERELSGALQGLWWNGNPERTNRIVGEHWEHVGGEPHVRDRVGDAEVFYPPGAFFQSNAPMADRIVERVASWIPDGASVAEYYAGVGVLGLAVIRRCDRLVFNESTSASIEGLRLGLDALPPEVSARATISAGVAGDNLEALGDADTVIVDPPRKGLDAPLVARLAERPAGRLIYVACGLESFVRDADTLLDAGWSLGELETYDLFPYTDHVEIASRWTAGPDG